MTFAYIRQWLITSFLNALSNDIPKDERIITIEDSAELQIRGVPNPVRLETRNANMESVKPITILTVQAMNGCRTISQSCSGS